MVAKSNFLSNALLSHVWGKGAYAVPANYYFCLLKVAALPSDTGTTITEVAYTNYVRLLKASAAMSAVAAQTISNAATFTWATCGAAGDTAVGFAVCDAAALGNLLYYGLLAAPLIIATGDPPTVDAAALTVTES